jgi:hypothetical protein
MIRPALAMAALVALTGCGTTLPYAPEQQPPGAKISAAYRIVGDRLGVEIDTDGRRLEEVRIVRPDGSEMQAQTIEHAPIVYGSPVTVGFGMGGVSGGHGGAVGTGVGVSMPVGGGASSVQGNSFAFFPLDQIGPAPWRVLVKLAGTGPALIVVGGPPPPK